MMLKTKLFIGVALLIMAVIYNSACAPQQPMPTVTYTVPELKYLLLSEFENVFYVDPDFYPVAREGQEEKNALEQFPGIKANTEELSAILEHLSLPDKSEYTDGEKLLIYREHKKLTFGVEITSSGDTYRFVLRVGEDQGERIEGTITPSGEIKVLKREPSFNTYPICLAAGTLIDTPDGPVPVEQLDERMTVWTIDNSGQRIAGDVIKTTMTLVPSDFQVVRLGLSDGRTVTASPGHPTAEGRSLGKYQAGDTLDGALVVMVESVVYGGKATYDLLPDSLTGLYWANGVLLKSTLLPK